MPTDIAGAIAAGDQGALLLTFGQARDYSGFIRANLACPLHFKGASDVIDSGAHKITWTQVGRVTEPGRYLFTFGWLTITEADLAIWKKFPDASFTLVVQSASEAAEEYRLGAFVI